MNVKLQESLSALMDNEVDELELRRILKEVPQDKELQDTWRRWHLIGDSLRQEVHSRPATNLLGGIHAALDGEPLPVRQKTPRLAKSIPAPLRYLGQAAIAASVAAGVLLLSRPMGPDAGLDDVVASNLQVNAATTTGEFRPGELARAASFSDASPLDQDARDRLQEAVLREFSESRSTLQSRQSLEIPVNYTLPEH